jgi:sensor domain CHASE-containing protein
MWMRVADRDRVRWINLDRVGIITLDLEDEYALRVYVDMEVGAFVTRSPDTKIQFFADDIEAIEVMMEDLRRLPIHPSYLRDETPDGPYVTQMFPE